MKLRVAAKSVAKALLPEPMLARFRALRGGEAPMMEFSRLPENGMNCPVCAEAAVQWASAYPSSIRRFRMAVALFCSHCGSGFVPGADELVADYYAYEYAKKNRGDREGDPVAYFRDLGSLNAPYAGRAKHQIAALRAQGARFGRVLDYGSGPGYFLFLCKPEQGFAVELDTCSDKYLAYIGARKIDPAVIPKRSYDIIVASHVIEHLTETTLARTLRSLVGALDNGGVLLIEVPTGLHGTLSIRRDESPHTLFFSPHGIREAVRRAGGKIVDCYERVESGNEAVRDRPIYRPDQGDSFACSLGDGLTVIARRD